MVSAVILVHNATPDTIIQFQDQLANDLPMKKGKWNFTFRIFKNNPYAIPEAIALQESQNPESKFMYTLSPSYIPGSTITLINGRSVGVFSSTINEEATELGLQTECIPDEHLDLGATTGLNDPFDFFANQKLQSLWTQKQMIKGEGGQIYELENGNLCIRTSNVFLHGSFNGLLIQVEVSEKSFSLKNVSMAELTQRILKKYGVAGGNVCSDTLNTHTHSKDKYGDLCWQYSRILDF
ncbi:SRB2 [Candida theae]|uniref:Mediator of RNA polymerase II transcription subunit 20 n=1 Tax=Candida theae TaxID=1198502 RepID=A0AAD5BB46_9ASCO|nr:SRB2 [Candida theae]KAI5949244.1 SRB2 [Candida theae]